MSDDYDELWISWHRPTSVRDALEQVCSNALWGCLLVLIPIGAFFWIYIISNIRTCCGLRTPKNIKRMRRARMRKKSTPVPLPVKRKRALTAPLPDETPRSLNPWATKQKMIDQSASVLYSKLPFELRMHIFEYVIRNEGSVVHICRVGKQISYWRCTKQLNGRPCTYSNPCSKALPFLSIRLNTERRYISGDMNLMRHVFSSTRITLTHNTWGVVSLLRSCRQIYTEVIGPLYSLINFHFPDPKTLTSFKTVILPRRLDAIRVISLDWEPTVFGVLNSGFGFHSDVYEIIQNMSSLQELRIYLKTLHMEENSSNVVNLKTRLMDISTRVRLCEVIVPSHLVQMFRELFVGTEVRVVDESAIGGG